MEDRTPKMFVLLFPGFLAAFSVFLSSQMSPVTALAVENTASPRVENVDSLSAANTFALKLFKMISANESSNVFLSPSSVSTALLMVLLGARNNTAAQIAKVLSIPKDGEVHQRFGKLISDINKPGANFSLSQVNQLFGETSYDFLASYTESIQRLYHGGLEKVNFKQAPEDSRRHINAWVAEKTSGKIQNLLGPGVVNSLTKVVLVNTMYFAEDWADLFDKNQTQEKPFWINKNENKPVQMMFKNARYNYAHIPASRISILEMPYAGEVFSMFITLPDAIEDNSSGLETLEREMTHEKLMDWIKKMKRTEIDLSLPKFKLEAKYDLKPVLKSMGMTDAFDVGKADFSGMSTNNDLVISEVVHKSFIEVNEEGTEAAAATGVNIAFLSARSPIEFKADHPFEFYLIDRSTNNIRTLGRFSSP
ncbi:serpin B6-like isoform X2 [Thamnophis elegans]|uniref:serpin B6-like isoform X2 n=1 Tax=Thamnophis elegans TaxID=35005 RepID=UPI001377FD0E|nr:serpin B6-like isoform X2 [Thamnophis elegans]